VHPDNFYLGLKSSDKQVKDGRDVSLQGALVDWGGNLVTETVSVEIEILEVQNEWIWEYDDDLGRSTWRRFLREIQVGAEKLKAKNGKFKYSFKPAGHAEGYIVRASAGDNARTDLYLEGEGYDWWWDEDYEARADRTPSPMVPDGIVVDVKGTLEVGKPMAASMNLPYPGRLLFTVETDEVLESRWLDIRKPGPFTTTFTINEFKPNVYVSALLVKDPFFESRKAFIPGRAFGVRSVQVRPSRHEMKLTLTVPDEVQPNQELVVKLDTGLQNTRVYATIAAVDEGILQLTKFETPDPLSLMFKKRGLLVNTFETIGWTLLLPPNSGSQTTGGDGDEWEGEPEEAAGRVHPIKPVALWSGLLEVGADGRTEVKFEVPTYRGQLRVMAVAASPSRIASADADVKVRDPLVLQVSFPRFLMSEDVFVVPVFLTNMTGKEGGFEVEFKTSANVNQPVGYHYICLQVHGLLWRRRVQYRGEGRRQPLARPRPNTAPSQRAGDPGAVHTQDQFGRQRSDRHPLRLEPAVRADHGHGHVKPLRQGAGPLEVPDPLSLRLHRADHVHHPAPPLYQQPGAIH
jgi:hypothetical protein